jgi:hypothetical protein
MWKANGKTVTLLLVLDSLVPKAETIRDAYKLHEIKRRKAA